MSVLVPENLRAVAGGRWLSRPGATDVFRGVGIDSREDLGGKIFVAISGERFDGHDFLREATARGARLLVVEREIDVGELPDGVGVLKVEETRRALGRMASAYRQSLRLTKVIAITGSAGKTTTKELVHAMLSTSLQGTAAPRSYNNHIGVPLTLLGADPSDAYVVVEIGTNGRGEVATLSQMAEPDVGVITLAGRSHLEGLGTLEDVSREKMALVGYLRPGGMAIVNADIPQFRTVARTHRPTVLYGEADDADLRLTAWGGDRKISWFEVNHRQRFELTLPGRHNAMNALAAWAVAKRLGVEESAAANALLDFSDLPMRMERLRMSDRYVYNDAYNANPESMNAALDTFADAESSATGRVLILGEMHELGEAGPELHRELADRIIEIDTRASIDHVILVGELAGHTAAELKRTWDKTRVTQRKDAAGAREVIRRVVKPGDSVLVKGSRAVGLERVIRWLDAKTTKTTKKRKTSKKVSKSKKKSAPRSRR